MDAEAPSASRYVRPADSPGFRFWRQFLVWQRGLNEVLRPYGLTQPQFAILAMCGWLCRSAGATSQKRIAAETGLEKMHVSQGMSRLVRAGLVCRVEDGPDGRMKPLMPTAAGWRLLVQTLPVVEAFDDKFFERHATH